MAAIWGLVPIGVAAQSSTTIQSDYYRHIEQAENVVVAGDDLFGERHDVSSGSISFSHTVVSLPGGNGLPVQVAYTFKPYQRLGVGYAVELARPYIAGIFSTRTGWVATSITGGGPTTARCSSPIGQPPELDNTDGKPERFFSEEYWAGNQLVLADGTSEFMGRLPQGASVPSAGGPYTWGTKSHWLFSCETPPQFNGAEAFVGLAPDGTRYYFEEPGNGITPLAIRKTAELGGDTIMQRREVRFYASKIQDRFGNWVTYTHDASGALIISANDGRRLTVSDANGVLTVSDGVRSWKVTFSANSPGFVVDNPDNTHWSIQESGGISDATTFLSNSCGDPPSTLSGQATIVVSASSGAVATYTIDPVHFGKSFVTYQCRDESGKGYPSIVNPAFYDAAALTKKVVSGPGLSTRTWSYSYGASNGCYAGSSAPASVACNSNSPTYHQVVVTRPDSSVVRYTVNNKWNTDTDGLLVKEETGASLSSISRVVSTEWAAFQDNLGLGNKLGGSASDYYRRVPSKVSTVQDGDAFVWQAEGFNQYSQVTKAKRFSSIAGQQAIEESLGYLNDTSLWVLGLPTTVTNVATGEVESENVYLLPSDTPSGKDTLKERWRFGQKLMSYSFDSAGNLHTSTDGRGNITTLGSYKRGIPQSIGHPDGTSESLVVDDFGQITRLTDQAGKTTSYAYDGVGRLTQITYPTGDNVAWAPKVFTYAYVTAAERGIGANHWRRTVSHGNARSVTYFDAELRPVLSDTYLSDGTAHTTARTDYDWRGQKTFVSYPRAGALNLGDLTGGTRTQYDALGRVHVVQQDSELSQSPTTTTDYLSGARVRVTDPKGNVTTTTYQVFDQPSYDAVTQVQAPDGINQAITRDVYGNPTSIRQYGSYNGLTKDLTKYLYYDAYHRLCRTAEPESGSTVMAYDAANNVAWTADGLSISGSDCGQGSVLTTAQTTRTYDAMNRVKTLVPPSGTQGTSYAYDALGNVKTAVSGVSSWSAGPRNGLGLLTSETLQITGQSAWTLGYGYDANGSLSSVSYPDGTTVDYAPDALGRPTQVGSYATGVTYFPSGEVSAFTFGNGALYSVNQNERQLLKNFSYALNVSSPDISELYTYDANGNITQITDLTGGLRTKGFHYDDLNRLTSATAPNLWGTESYTYDPLNNIASRTGNSTKVTYSYDATNRLTDLSDGTTFGYDNRGNVTSKNGVVLSFDAKNQLQNVGGSVAYAYDASGRRVSKTPSSGGSTYYFYSQAGQLMYQLEPGSAKATDYVYLGKRMLARNETTQLGAPSSIGFDTNPNDGSYTVSWSAVAGATSYTLQESANGGVWSTIYAGAATSEMISGKAGGSYQYRVEGCIASTCGSWTTSATLGVRPALPVVITPKDIVHGAYVVSWTTPPGTKSFDVQERLDGGSWVVLASETTATTVDRPGNAGSYEYRVSAKNIYGTRGWGLSSTVLVGSPPVPNLTTPTDSNTGTYVVSWTAVSGAISYVLQEKVGGNDWAVVQTTDKTALTITGKSNGEYGYRVQACNSAGCSEFSVSHTTTVLLPPNAPATIDALSVVSTGTIQVTWTASDTATQYVLQEKINGGGWNSVYTGSATRASLIANGTGGHTYQVQACNAGGCSGFTVSATLLVTITPASAPALSVPSSSSTGSYTVSWTSVSNAESYDLQQSSDGGTWSTVKRGAVTSVSITGMGSGNYSYRVFACASGCGPSSAIKSIAVTVALPGTPSAPRVDLSGPSYRTIASLTWDATGGATSYSVEKHAADGTTTVFYEGPNTSFAKLDNSASTSGYRVKACNATGCSPYGAYGYGGAVQVPIH